MGASVCSGRAARRVVTFNGWRRDTWDFLDQVLEEMPFSVQRIQTDRGTEFFAEEVQRRLMDETVRFRPIPPRSPHSNGKVERAQRTCLEEFGQ